MATQFRDTEFGRVVRLLSGNQLLQYPDEIDPSLHKKPVLQCSSSTVVERGHHLNESQTPRELEDFDHQVTRRATNCSDKSITDTEVQTDNVRNDTFLVDWYGRNDPENPQNWPSIWKWLVAIQVCVLNFAVYICSSIYVPGEESFTKDFHVSQEVALLGLSLFTVGYGLGPMLWSPMSEIPALGRSPIYVYTLLAFILFQLPTGFAVDLPMFLIFRLLTGFCGSPCLATGGATLSDIFDPARTAYWIPIWGSFGILGPVFGPLIGGFVAPALGWQWTIWVVTILCAFVWLILIFLLPETSAANILYKRAQRLRKITGDNRYKSQSELDTAQQTAKAHFLVLGRAFTLTFFEPIILTMDLYTALLYGVFFTWFESFPLVFGGIYDFSTQLQGLVYIGILVGGLITVPLFLLWIKYGIVPQITKPGFKPEMVLPPTFFGSAFLPICLFFYGWTARKSIHWIVPIIGSSFFTISIVTLFNPILTYQGISYPEYSASIFAGNALFRASFGASFPLFARQLFETLGIGPGNSLLGGLAVLFIPIPYVFSQYGVKIRHMSKNARHDV